MLIGYARISTHDQTLALQQDALEKAGCDRIFTDKVSGTKQERKGLRACLVRVRVEPFWRCGVRRGPI
jgi:DNA invertase Pin-like site-specific DNA recombinase